MIMEKETYNKSLYEDTSTDYSSLLETTNSAFRAPIVRLMNRLDLKKGMHLLDVGAGIGRDMIDLAALVAPRGTVTGLEIAQPHFEKAVAAIASSTYSRNIQIHHCDIFCFDTPEETYDLIWCKYTLACFLDPLAALRRMRTLLKKNGRIVVINDLCPMHWLPGTLLGEDRARESRLYNAIFESINQHRLKRREALGLMNVYNTSCVGLMQQAGYHGIETITEVAEALGRLTGPLKETLSLFLQRSFTKAAKNQLSAEDRKYVHEIRDPESPSYLLNRDDLHIIKPITALTAFT